MLKIFSLLFLLSGSASAALIQPDHLYKFEHNLSDSAGVLNMTQVGTVVYTNTPTGTNGSYCMFSPTDSDSALIPSQIFSGHNGSISFDLKINLNQTTNYRVIGDNGLGSGQRLQLVPEFTGTNIFFLTQSPSVVGGSGEETINWSVFGTRGIGYNIIFTWNGTNISMWQRELTHATSWTLVQSLTRGNVAALDRIASMGVDQSANGTTIDNLAFYNTPITDPNTQYFYTYAANNRSIFWFGNSLVVGNIGGTCTPALNGDGMRYGFIKEAGAKGVGYTLAGTQNLSNPNKAVWCPFENGTSGISVTAGTGTAAGSFDAAFQATFPSGVGPGTVSIITLNTNNVFYGMDTPTARTQFDEILARHTAARPTAPVILCGDVHVNCGSQPCDPTVWNTMLKGCATFWKAQGFPVYYFDPTTLTVALCTDSLHYNQDGMDTTGTGLLDFMVSVLDTPASAGGDSRRRRSR